MGRHSCLCYYAYCKIIAVKMVFVRFWGWTKKKFWVGAAALSPPRSYMNGHVTFTV